MDMTTASIFFYWVWALPDPSVMVRDHGVFTAKLSGGIKVRMGPRAFQTAVLNLSVFGTDFISEIVKPSPTGRRHG